MITQLGLPFRAGLYPRRDGVLSIDEALSRSVADMTAIPDDILASIRSAAKDAWPGDRDIRLIRRRGQNRKNFCTVPAQIKSDPFFT
jgi:hypothetical protein